MPEFTHYTVEVALAGGWCVMCGGSIIGASGLEFSQAETQRAQLEMTQPRELFTSLPFPRPEPHITAELGYGTSLLAPAPHPELQSRTEPGYQARQEVALPQPVRDPEPGYARDLSVIPTTGPTVTERGYSDVPFTTTHGPTDGEHGYSDVPLHLEEDGPTLNEHGYDMTHVLIRAPEPSTAAEPGYGATRQGTAAAPSNADAILEQFKRMRVQVR